ncbi:hypothetical protein DXA30_12400 [Fusobacterium ulcerans]|nr:hypothetical protein DXA30_12400 [Fusobacterium ulcerans]
MTLLIIYFLEKELLWKANNEKRRIAFLKTFFLLKNLRNSYFICSIEKLFENYKLKKKFSTLEYFCETFYKILIYENGCIYNSEEERNYYTDREFSIVFENMFKLRELVEVEI